MPDFMDHVQDQVQRNLDDALAKATRRGIGLTHCEECDAPISGLRQQLGARLCVAHQSAKEAEQARGGRR